MTAVTRIALKLHLVPTMDWGVTSFFADLSVRTKILAAAATAGVVAGAVGITTLIALDHSSEAAQKIYSNNVAGTAKVAAIETGIIKVRLDVSNHIVSRDAANLKKYRTSFDTHVKQVDAAFDAYRAGSPAASPTELSALEAAWAKYVSVAEDKLLPASERGDVAGWQAVRDAEVLPLMATTEAGLTHVTEAETAAAASSAAAAHQDYTTSRLISLILLVAGLLAAFAVAWRVAGGIRRSVGRVKDVCLALAAGDLTRTTGLTIGDETGQMGRALDTALVKLRSTVSTIDGSAVALSSAAAELSEVSTQIASSAEQTSAQARNVSSATEQISRSVDTVSAGGEEMGAAIREISENASEAARIAADAVTLTTATSATMAKLNDSSAQIGDVIKVITSIAEQTNLLALNATIEAARAGESGKGFAVVATEVKELAMETAKATEDISRRVQAIQADTGGAVTAIEEISQVIARISDFQTTIASAVEEQTATTSEMNRSVGEAAAGTGEIAFSITGVADAARLTSDGVGKSRHASTELSRMSQDLTQMVAGFKY
ncbi:MAG: methyl-accepting chemotaxis protein [Actinoplanes sp.]